MFSFLEFIHVFDIRVSQMRRMKQRFPHMVSTRQFLQSARRSLEVIYGKGSVRMSAVLPRRHALGYRETGGTHGHCEPADGESLLAARGSMQ